MGWFVVAVPFPCRSLKSLHKDYAAFTMRYREAPGGVWRGMEGWVGHWRIPEQHGVAKILARRCANLRLARGFEHLLAQQDVPAMS